MAYWRGWTEDVRLYVNRCNTCGRYRRGPGKKQGAMQQALGCTVMQKVHIDLTGPHPISRNGYKYLLTAICSFSKFLIAVPIRDKTSLVVAKALLKNVYLVYGLPEILVHDQGGEFWSDVMTDLAKLLRIQVSKITSHRPSSNGVVEHVHATINSIFAKLVRDWCELTPYVVHAYNTAYHSSTTFSPFYLMFMRRPHRPIALELGTVAPEEFESSEEYVQSVSNRMREAYAVVRSQLKCSFDRAKKRYDRRVKETNFQVGQFVWYYVPRNKRGRSRKWELHTTGPYRVIQSLNDVNK